jgi:hypothetical protein
MFATQNLVASRVELWFTPIFPLPPLKVTPNADPETLALVVSAF